MNIGIQKKSLAVLGEKTHLLHQSKSSTSTTVERKYFGSNYWEDKRTSNCSTEFEHEFYKPELDRFFSEESGEIILQDYISQIHEKSEENGVKISQKNMFVSRSKYFGPAIPKSGQILLGLAYAKAQKGNALKQCSSGSRVFEFDVKKFKQYLSDNFGEPLAKEIKDSYFKNFWHDLKVFVLTKQESSDPDFYSSFIKSHLGEENLCWLKNKNQQQKQALNLSKKLTNAIKANDIDNLIQLQFEVELYFLPEKTFKDLRDEFINKYGLRHSDSMVLSFSLFLKTFPKEYNSKEILNLCLEQNSFYKWDETVLNAIFRRNNSGISKLPKLKRVVFSLLKEGDEKAIFFLKNMYNFWKHPFCLYYALQGREKPLNFIINKYNNNKIKFEYKIPKHIIRSRQQNYTLLTATMNLLIQNPTDISIKCYNIIRKQVADVIGYEAVNRLNPIISL